MKFNPFIISSALLSMIAAESAHAAHQDAPKDTIRPLHVIIRNNIKNAPNDAPPDEFNSSNDAGQNRIMEFASEKRNRFTGKIIDDLIARSMDINETQEFQRGLKSLDMRTLSECTSIIDEIGTDQNSEDSKTLKNTSPQLKLVISTNQEKERYPETITQVRLFLHPYVKIAEASEAEPLLSWEPITFHQSDSIEEINRYFSNDGISELFKQAMSAIQTSKADIAASCTAYTEVRRKMKRIKTGTGE